MPQQEKLKKAREFAAGYKVQGGEKAAFHVCAPIGWANDPNGFSLYQGEAHLFFQYYPYAPKWGPMHWGHCKTHDFVAWETLPVALAPDMPYETGCFSGCALEVNGRQALLYTADKTVGLPDGTHSLSQTQALAFGDGIDYEKYEGNPVLTADTLPEGAYAPDFRDPKVWREDDRFYMVIGSRPADGSGQVLLYESGDLKTWRYLCVIDASRNEYGRMWECPDFFALDGRQVLLVSPQEMKQTTEFHGQNGTLACLGAWDAAQHEFTRQAVQSVDYGMDFYAPQTLLTPDGRRVMIAWMKSWDNEVTPDEMNWNGMMTFPREIHVCGNRILQQPVREIERYRGAEHRVEGLTAPCPQVLANGRQMDMLLTVGGAGSASFTVQAAAGRHWHTDVVYNAPEGTVTIDRTYAGMKNARPIITFPLHELRERVTLRLLLDKYSMELFVNDGAETATVLLYTPQTADAVTLTAEQALPFTAQSWPIVLPKKNAE